MPIHIKFWVETIAFNRWTFSIIHLFPKIKFADDYPAIRHDPQKVPGVETIKTIAKVYAFRSDSALIIQVQIIQFCVKRFPLVDLTLM